MSSRLNNDELIANLVPSIFLLTLSMPTLGYVKVDLRYHIISTISIFSVKEARDCLFKNVVSPSPAEQPLQTDMTWAELILAAPKAHRTGTHTDWLPADEQGRQPLSFPLWSSVTRSWDSMGSMPTASHRAGHPSLLISNAVLSDFRHLCAHPSWLVLILSKPSLSPLELSGNSSLLSLAVFYFLCA